MTCISCKSLDWYKSRITIYRTLKMLLEQQHPVVFSQNICYMIKTFNLFYLKVLEVTLHVFEVLLILNKKRAFLENAQRASTS